MGLQKHTTLKRAELLKQSIIKLCTKSNLKLFVTLRSCTCTKLSSMSYFIVFCFTARYYSPESPLQAETPFNFALCQTPCFVKL